LTMTAHEGCAKWSWVSLPLDAIAFLLVAVCFSQILGTLGSDHWADNAVVSKCLFHQAVTV
jgi:hypothetical protein